MTDLKKILKEESLNFGAEITLKKLRQGKLKKIFLAANCPKNVKDDIEYYAKLSKVEVVNLDVDNEELGTLCKKPFSISVIGI